MATSPHRESDSPLTDLDSTFPDASSSAMRTPVSKRGGRGGSSSTGGKARGSSTPGKRYPASRATPVVISAERREANRLAAERSRVRQGERAKILETMAKGLAEENMALKERVRKLIAMGVVPPEGLEALVKAIIMPSGRSIRGELESDEAAQINDAEAQALLQHLRQSGNGGDQAMKDREALMAAAVSTNSHEAGVDGLLHLGINNNALSELAAAAEAAGTQNIDPTLADHDLPIASSSHQAQTLADPLQGLATKPLTREIESLLRLELAQLQEKFSSFPPSTSFDAEDIPPPTLNETPPEIAILRDMSRRMQESNDAAKERREKLKVELTGGPSASEGVDEGGKSKSAGETVERALTDVKARVELLLNVSVSRWSLSPPYDYADHIMHSLQHYNPSYVFSPLSAEDAFTLPDRFEPIPLPEPQRRGRPARDSPKPLPRRKRATRDTPEDEDSPAKRARTRLGRPGRMEMTLESHQPTRPSGLANELTLEDEREMEHDHHIDPSLSQVAGEGSYRVQHPDADGGDTDAALNQYLSSGRRGMELDLDFDGMERLE